MAANVEECSSLTASSIKVIHSKKNFSLRATEGLHTETVYIKHRVLGGLSAYPAQL